LVDGDGPAEVVDPAEGSSTSDVLASEPSFPDLVQPTAKPTARTHAASVRRTLTPPIVLRGRPSDPMLSS
jgi:hypothetical protein